MTAVAGVIYVAKFFQFQHQPVGDEEDDEDEDDSIRYRKAPGQLDKVY